jgi:hypothetical protein
VAAPQEVCANHGRHDLHYPHGRVFQLVAHALRERVQPGLK